jgi:chitodextrinase
MTKKSEAKRAKYRDRLKSSVEVAGQRTQPSSAITVKPQVSRSPAPVAGELTPIGSLVPICGVPP